MANQYDVLGKAPGLEELNGLSPNNVHLTIRGLNAGYGKMEILHNFDLTVSKGQSLCLIGPNGAGKSTILHSIYGFTNIFDGKIELEGNEITKLTPAEKLSKVGVAYILQDNSVFPDMTVEENLLMGGYIKDKQWLWNNFTSYWTQYESNNEFSTKNFLFSTWKNVSRRFTGSN